MLAIADKIKMPMWPVPRTLGTYAVLSNGVAYGPRQNLLTIGGYLIIGALVFDVFAGSSKEVYALSYMLVGMGGYLVDYVFVVFLLGIFAQMGWDRSILTAALGMLIGNIIIYISGILLLDMLYGRDKPLFEWGLTPYDRRCCEVNFGRASPF